MSGSGVLSSPEPAIGRARVEGVAAGSRVEVERLSEDAQVSGADYLAELVVPARMNNVVRFYT